MYADCGNFRKCILLWLYALDTQQKSLEPLHPMIQSSFLSFTELFQYMQKQLSPFNSTGQSQNSRDTASDALKIPATTSTSNAGVVSTLNNAGTSSPGGSNSTADGSMFNILNMYTQTVLKMLQQAVEEIKRGMNLIKQDQNVVSLNHHTTTHENDSNNNTINNHSVASSSSSANSSTQIHLDGHELVNATTTVNSSNVTSSASGSLNINKTTSSSLASSATASAPSDKNKETKGI